LTCSQRRASLQLLGKRARLYGHLEFSKPRDTRGFCLSGDLTEKKHSDEMAGEALREAGTLVVVFAPLYVIFEKSDADWYTVVSALLVGVALLMFGIEVERRRQL